MDNMHMSFPPVPENLFHTMMDKDIARCEKYLEDPSDEDQGKLLAKKAWMWALRFCRSY